MGQQHPERCSELFIYLDSVYGAYKTHEGSACWSYDEEFRCRLVLQPELLGQRISRTFNTSSRVQMQNRVPDKQKIFQADNDLPVHLKGGTGDLLLYRITMGITIAGGLLAFCKIIMASIPQKK